MKQLIQPICQKSIEIRNPKDINSTIILKQYKEYAKLKYIELPDTLVTTIDNINDTTYCTYNGFNKKLKGKKYIDYWYDKNNRNENTRYIRIWEDDFVKVIEEIKYQVKDEKYYTIEHLMKNLSATDFIDYMKDRGMSVCHFGK